MIKPDTISSMHPVNDSDSTSQEKSDTDNPTPMPAPSTNKKLSSKSSKTDQVLTYLKTSVSTHT